jgi:colanic acid/amylovoran biosynthesis protein
LLRTVIWRWLKKRFNKDLGFLLANRELRAYKDAHLVIDLSGDMLTEDYGPHVAYSHFLPILLALAMGKPVLCIAQSIGPFKQFRRLARFLLRNAARVTVRDPVTLSYLQREEILEQDRMELTADLAFLLDPAPVEHLSETMNLNRPPVSDAGKMEPWLGIAVSPLIQSHYQRKNPQAKQRDFISLIAEAADLCHAKFGTRAIFIPHVTGPKPGADDRLIAQAIAAKMQSPHHVITGDYRPGELKALISKCNVILGARMHANIAATSSRVPVVAISYSHKTEGIMQLLEIPELVLPIDSIDTQEIMSLLDQVFSNREWYVQKLQQIVPEVTRQSARNIDVVAEFIQEMTDAQ